MDTDIRERLTAARKQLVASPAHQQRTPADKKHSLKENWRYLPLVFSIGIGIVFLGVFAVLMASKRNGPAPSASIVPQSVIQSVSFPVYYPDPKELPQGYTLDLASFSATNQAVVYSVVYDTNKKIAFTVQAKPPENDLKVFYVNQLPLRNEVKVPAGTAAIGVLNNQTLVSLPTNENAWLLVTAPLDTNQERLQELLQAIKR